MTIGAFKEEDVLKIVHPGKYIEIHHNPIIASKIMERNPRHFVTRPDVFKFPWIVVRPESILMPGKVFYIVPCHTLHRLLRDNKSLINTRRQNSPVSQTVVIDERKQKKPEGAKSCLKKNSCGNTKSNPGRHVIFHLPDGAVAVGGVH